MGSGEGGAPYPIEGLGEEKEAGITEVGFGGGTFETGGGFGVKWEIEGLADGLDELGFGVGFGANVVVIVEDMKFAVILGYEGKKEGDGVGSTRDSDCQLWTLDVLDGQGLSDCFSQRLPIVRCRQ